MRKFHVIRYFVLVISLIHFFFFNILISYLVDTSTFTGSCKEARWSFFTWVGKKKAGKEKTFRDAFLNLQGNALARFIASPPPRACKCRLPGLNTVLKTTLSLHCKEFVMTSVLVSWCWFPCVSSVVFVKTVLIEGCNDVGDSTLLLALLTECYPKPIERCFQKYVWLFCCVFAY